MSSITFSSAVATFYQIDYAPSKMIDGDFSNAQGNGWAVAGLSDAAADALLTIASPLPAGQYNLTFKIYQNYNNPGHILGDFALDYTTAASPTLSSTQIPVSIQNASSLNGTTFSLLSPGELLANTSNNSLGIDTYTISAIVYSASPITGIFLDAIKNPSLPGGGPGGQYPNGNFVVSEFTLDAMASLMSGTVSAGQVYNVSSGQVDSGDLVDFGGELDVLSGGTISNTVNHGTINVSSGGKSINTYDYNSIVVSVGGIATSTTIVDVGSQSVYGIASGSFVAGGTEVVYSGGTATDTSVVFNSHAGHQEVASGGVASGTAVDAANYQQIDTGGTAKNATINGVQYVQGLAVGTVVNTLGIEYVSSGGTAKGTVLSGGIQNVASGGIATSTIISSGDQDVYGSAINTVIVGGEQDVYGTASNTEIDGGGQNVYGTAINTEIKEGQQNVYGLASSTVVEVGGSQFVNSGGTAVDNIIYANQYVYDGAAVSRNTVQSGGAQYASGYATVSATKIAFGGSQHLNEFATGSNNVVNSGGVQYVEDFANADATVVLGVQDVEDFATAIATTISSGGLQDLTGHSTASGTVVRKGGTQYVEDFATASGTTISSGGTMRVLADATTIDPNLKSGGTVFLDGTMDLSGPHSFLSAGGVVLSADAQIDFVNIASAGTIVKYASKTANSGALTVSSGGHIVASINLVGHYTTADFHPSDDGSGHLEITDPPVILQKAGNAPATIADGTVLEINVLDTGKVTFAGPSGTLWLDSPSIFTGKVADFGAQESIDLPFMHFGVHTTLGFSENSSHTGGVLTVKDGTHVAKIALLGNYIAASFTLAADGHGGTLITEGSETTQQPLLTQPRA